MQQSALAPITVRISDVRSQRVSWLWPGMIPRGKLTVLCGDPGLGKSFLTLDLCARASHGGPWPLATGEPHGKPLGSVLLSAEDDPADTLRPRLEAQGANLALVRVVDALKDSQDRVYDFVIGDHARHLAAMISSDEEVGLLVVDPVSAYVGATDSYNNAQVRGMLKPLADLAADFNIAVVLVTHMRKGEATKALHATMGSLAFTAAARVVLMVTRDPNDPNARIIATVKSNLAPDRRAFRFRINDGKMEWLDSFNAQADEVIAQQQSKAAKPEPLSDEAFAKDLRAFIEETKGERASAEVQRFAKEKGFSFDRLKRAAFKGVVGATVIRTTAGWVWRLV